MIPLLLVALLAVLVLLLASLVVLLEQGPNFILIGLVHLEAFRVRRHVVLRHILDLF